mmetsp:Transcript_72510/g.182927  ORF Transcript_72510/g.182927 Transcript_72510/m.182927 type:complete len:232 (-) Transcript_72510:437-1132(-)
MEAVACSCLWPTSPASDSSSLSDSPSRRCCHVDSVFFEKSSVALSSKVPSTSHWAAVLQVSGASVFTPTSTTFVRTLVAGIVNGDVTSGDRALSNANFSMEAWEKASSLMEVLIRVVAVVAAHCDETSSYACSCDWCSMTCAKNLSLAARCMPLVFTSSKRLALRELSSRISHWCSCCMRAIFCRSSSDISSSAMYSVGSKRMTLLGVKSLPSASDLFFKWSCSRQWLSSL